MSDLNHNRFQSENIKHSNIIIHLARLENVGKKLLNGLKRWQFSICQPLSVADRPDYFVDKG